VQQNKADIGGIEQAMAKRGAASCDYASMKRSPAGESGIKYKVDKDADSKGEEAFKSLDNYMKKAGLNSFQASFFGRLIQSGLDESAIRSAVKQANSRFGVKVASELNTGLNKLAFAALAARALPFLSRAGQGVANFARGIGGAKGVANVGPGLRDLVTKAPVSITEASKAMSPAFGAGNALNQGVKNVLTGAGARQGAASGLLNPYTGLMSNSAYDDDGNINFTNLAGSTLGGALGGRALGRIGGSVASTGKRMQQQMMAGSSLGGAVGGLGGLAGLPTDFTSGAQLGGLAGFAPGRLREIPGLSNLATNPNVPKAVQRALNMPTSAALSKYDPQIAAYRALRPYGNQAIQAAKPYANQAYQAAKPYADQAYQAARPYANQAYQAVKAAPGQVAQAAKPYVDQAMQFARANPGTVAKNTLLGGGALATGYGALQIPGAIQSGIENAGQSMLQSPDVQNRLKSLDQVIGEGRGAIAQGREALGNVNSAVKPFVGQNGQSNWLGGLLSSLGGGGQIGQFVQDNQQWLLPALMSGVGAGGGYMMGGGGGAALGGIGLPLLYALANQGGMGGQQGGGGAQQKALENASALAMPSEIERQKKEQTQLSDSMKQQFQDQERNATRRIFDEN
jgi:hypothetical protein